MTVSPPVSLFINIFKLFSFLSWILWNFSIETRRKNFCQILNHILIGLYTNSCFQKSERVLGRLFECQFRIFPKLLCSKYNQYNLCTAALQCGPPLPGSWANFGGPYLTYFSKYFNIFFVFLQNKTKSLRFLIHCFMINTFQVISNTGRKSIILT